MRPPRSPHRVRSIALATLATVLVAAAGACGGDDVAGGDAAPSSSSGAANASGDPGASPAGGSAGDFTSFADVIPAGVSGAGHVVGVFDATALDAMGLPTPAADDADLVRYLDDVTQSLGRTGLGESFDGLSCTTACEPDRYGEDVVEALGYAPLAFDRAVLVGEPPSSLTILQGGGVDPDDVVAAFDGDDGYRVEPAGRGVRITSDCAPRRTRCVEPGPRDELGRGVHVYVDDTWRAISVDPDAVDAFVARIDGGGDPLPTDAPERTVLAWADDLEVVSGQGWAPMAGQRCADDDLPDARAALAGTGARGAGDPAPVVLRVALTDDADADAAADAVEAATAEGAGCGSTSSIVSDYLEDLRVAVDGADVTLTATAADTVPARWPNAPADELPRGAIWTQLLLRADLPWSRPAQEGDEAGTSGTSGPGSPGSTGTSNIDGTGWGS
ncbi:MAG: hypothetical protein KDB33_11430 [Acidimicrobiales bacterium]|nr:hypothetical protein [Acidimicrobiales bacterium]